MFGSKLWVPSSVLMVEYYILSNPFHIKVSYDTYDAFKDDYGVAGSTLRQV